MLDRAADGLEAVEVFDLDDGCLDEVAVTECEVAVDVGLEPHVALLQHTLARAEEAADVAEGLAEDDDLFGGLKVWLRHHFEQGGSGAVEVEDGMVDRAATGCIVQELAGVLLEVGADDADAARRGVVVYSDGTAALLVEREGAGDVERTVEAEGPVVLADLVPLGHVGVEVALAVPAGEVSDLAVEGEADLDGELHRPPIQHGERTR